MSKREFPRVFVPSVGSTFPTHHPNVPLSPLPLPFPPPTTPTRRSPRHRRLLAQLARAQTSPRRPGREAVRGGVGVAWRCAG
ncbi:hypothetical protein M427DRAFT_56738 [Gonapodya prolifera JEL478]|uniref:Uncharacterized protein n=1 Tax=Gonapodya prolifera (strain JEL478) TaxID=1344416 RepID=A0A139AF45_GONPJ|nr:hypothetical protein M427DRAFT_56738 [Gonapodya prolifera JEL478]|eukprot:KXS15378.1 hypothetical protein M427DRAFT_56738 [Gonapodya prolifera JEL478]